MFLSPVKHPPPPADPEDVKTKVDRLLQDLQVADWTIELKVTPGFLVAYCTSTFMPWYEHRAFSYTQGKFQPSEVFKAREKEADLAGRLLQAGRFLPWEAALLKQNEAIVQATQEYGAKLDARIDQLNRRPLAIDFTQRIKSKCTDGA